MDKTNYENNNILPDEFINGNQLKSYIGSEWVIENAGVKFCSVSGWFHWNKLPGLKNLIK